MHEFNDTQLRILCALSDGRSQAHVDLTGQLGIKPNTLSDALHKLISEEFILRGKPVERPQGQKWGRGRPKEPLELTTNHQKLAAVCAGLEYRMSEMRHEFYKKYAEKWHKLVIEGKGDNDFCKEASKKFNLLSDFESAYFDIKKKRDETYLGDYFRRIEGLKKEI